MMTTVQQMSSFEFQMVCAVRLILASCCGLCIGIERTNRLKDAGIRTHLIVCMGAALMMLVSKYGFFDVSPLTEFFKADVSRVASSVVAGVGFLGAGIIFERNRSVTGLTTAAGIWTTAGIGMAMGGGSGEEKDSGGILEAMAPKVTIAGQEVSTADNFLELQGVTLTSADIENIRQMSNLLSMLLQLSNQKEMFV